ncbi:MAG TPA: hypothetical protein VNA69_16465 [Thermoanaerobaculia bacterium]|nr:hypothetical protein [Thermoanaerobaculia bacterium]
MAREERRIAEWTAIVLAAAAKLWLTAARTLEAIGWAVYDDRWFTERARAILQGQWLGDYSHLTLIKGPAYPLWIAFVASLKIPLLFAQQLLYAIACLAVCLALAPALRSSMARAALFIVLLFNPMTFSDEIATRVTREGFYPALTLLVFAAVAAAVLRRKAMQLRWASLCGITIAFFWLTREEGVWIVPLLALAIIALRWKPRWLVMTAAMFAAIYGAVVLGNGLRYGVFEAVEFKEKSFLRAYGSLTHVRQHPPRARIPVPKETRERVYAVSPAFAELRPFLEGQLGTNWASASMPQGGGEIGGAWFMWAFREAVAEAGYYERGAAAVREYYDRLAREIEAARLAGRLDARPARASMLPPLLPGQRREVLKTWARRLLRTPAFTEFAVTPRPSQGLETELRDFAQFTRSRIAPRRKSIVRSHLVGWVVHVDGPLDITIERSDGSPVPGARVTRLPSPDLYEHLKQRWKDFPPARHARFDIRVPSGDALLVLSLRGREIERIPITDEPMVSFDPGVRMSIDKAEVETTEPKLGALDAFRLRVLNGIGRVYQWAFPPILGLAALLYAMKWRRADRTMMLLIAGLLAAVAARVMILALIDVTAFQVFMGGYQSPSHALLLAAGVLMAHEGLVSRK